MLDNADNYVIALCRVMAKEIPKHWLVRPVPVEWLRGPAWIDGGDIVMDGPRASTYHPLAEPEIGMELARVRTPKDAVTFVGRFGLLYMFGRPTAGRLKKRLREPFTGFEAVAGELSFILETARLVRRGSDGDAKAIRHLHEMILVPEDGRVSVRDDETGEYVERRAGDVLSPEERFVDADDHTILMHANQYRVAELLNEGIADGPACVHDRAFAGESTPPGKLRFGIRPASLAGVCYLSVALALTEQAAVGVCADPTCGRPFFIRDKRQRFCDRACGNRVRFRRFMDKQGTAATPPKEGDG